MITIKDLLFKLLDEIEPNELLELKIFQSYGTVFVANKRSILPLATEMRYEPRSEESLEMIYRRAFSENIINEYEKNYVETHKVLINEKDYIIIEELIDVQYFDEYFLTTVSTPEGVFTNYYSYTDITSIRIVHKGMNSIVREFNTLNYKYKTNKN